MEVEEPEATHGDMAEEVTEDPDGGLRKTECKEEQFPVCPCVSRLSAAASACLG